MNEAQKLCVAGYRQQRREGPQHRGLTNFKEGEKSINFIASIYINLDRGPKLSMNYTNQDTNRQVLEGIVAVVSVVYKVFGKFVHFLIAYDLYYGTRMLVNI